MSPIILKKWLPLGVMATLLCGLAYVSLQQFMRQSADDLPAQIVGDVTSALGQGAPPTALFNGKTDDMAKSLSPFIIVVSETGVVLASSTQLNGTVPVPPQGVLDNAKTNGQNRVTWEPAPGVRQAIVVAPFKGRTYQGFAIAGNALTNVERHEMTLRLQVFMAWILTLTLSLLTMILVEPKQPLHHRDH